MSILLQCSNKGNTYVCVHAAGVHVVTLPIISQLKEYALADDSKFLCIFLVIG